MPVSNRRRFLAGASAATALGAVAGPLGFPAIVRAQTRPIPVGAVLPFSGGLELFGEQAAGGRAFTLERDLAFPSTWAKL